MLAVPVQLHQRGPFVSRLGMDDASAFVTANAHFKRGSDFLGFLWLGIFFLIIVPLRHSLIHHALSFYK